MEYTIRKMNQEDWEAVREIYLEGIHTKKATFQTDAPSYEEWNNGHLKEFRYVAVDEDNQVSGWIALSPTSSRCVYRGVVEVSIYVAQSSRKQNLGYELMKKVIEETEKNDIWTLYSGIISINEASIKLHKKCGFRVVGTRERIAKDADGVWQNVTIMERRSEIAGK